MRFGRLGPGAAYAHVAAGFVLLPQRGDPTEQDTLLQQYPEQGAYRPPTTCRAAIGPVFHSFGHGSETNPNCFRSRNNAQDGNVPWDPGLLSAFHHVNLIRTSGRHVGPLSVAADEGEGLSLAR